MSNLQQIKSIASEDLRIRTLGEDGQITLICLDGMSDDVKVAECAVRPLCEKGATSSTLQELERLALSSLGCNYLCTVDGMHADLLNGYTLIFCGDEENCISLDTRTLLQRAITQPPTDNVTKGPREGFVESMKTNLVLLRKRLKTLDFKINYLNVGKYTSTSIAVCYLDSIANKKLVDELTQKIQAISIDGIIDSSYVARYLDSRQTSLFKMVGSSERPDVVTAKLLEGRVAVVVDGSPIVLTLPYLFIEDVQGPQDYYDSPQITTVSRILRITSAIICLLLPALYVTLQLYNYQILPAKFLITIINATQAIPFDPLTEMLMVLVLFDILREANARMPSIAGLSLSIIGAIVLGDAAIRAGLLGAPAVMIGALSGIGLYTLPDDTLLLSILRLALTFIGGITGLLGLILSVLSLLAFTVSLTEYGTPYLAPYAPNILNDLQDGLIKQPLNSMKQRPRSLNNKNKTREG